MNGREDEPRASILIVEDDAANRVALEAVLDPLKARVVAAGSGEEALRHLVATEFAVVLMDVRLPGIDGAETARLMRGVSRTRMTPIILLTGVHLQPEDVLRGYDTGAVDYLLKPYDPVILRSKVSVFLELYRLRRMEKDHQQRLFQTVLTQMPDGVLVVAPNGQPLWFNNRLEEILGAHAEEGLRTAAMFRADGAPLGTDDHPIARALAKGEKVQDEEVLYRKGTQTLRLSLSVGPVFDEADGLIAVVATVSDITPRHEAERERERLMKALEKSNAALDRFAAVASHDLKAPLRGIGNLAAWIEEGLPASASDELRKYLSIMKERVVQAQALVSGILRDARAAESDEREAVALGELVRETWELLHPPAVAVLEVAELPVLQLERALLQQVLLNLIGNALKYARRIDVRVAVAGWVDDASLHLTVADNGPGIAPDAQQRIWQKFETLDGRVGEDSSGLGLALVKTIVEGRGGRTWVESSVGGGALFHVEWPIHGRADRR
jgi:PAS domain S-box-containing protein